MSDGEGIANARTGYYVKVGLMYLFTTYDLVANAMGDHNDHLDIPGAPLGIMGAQLGVHLLNCLVLFVLLFGTYLFQVGLIGTLLAEFKEVFYIIPIYFLVTGAQSGVKIVLLAVQKQHPVTLWDDDLFYALTVLKMIVALFYYVIIIRTTIKLGSPRLYMKGPWVATYQSHTV